MEPISNVVLFIKMMSDLLEMLSEWGEVIFLVNDSIRTSRSEHQWHRINSQEKSSSKNLFLAWTKNRESGMKKSEWRTMRIVPGLYHSRKSGMLKDLSLYDPLTNKRLHPLHELSTHYNPHLTTRALSSYHFTIFSISSAFCYQL